MNKLSDEIIKSFVARIESMDQKLDVNGQDNAIIKECVKDIKEDVRTLKALHPRMDTVENNQKWYGVGFGGVFAIALHLLKKLFP